MTIEALSLPDMVAILRIRNRCFWAVFSALFAVALIFALHWSNYRSSATVEIARSAIPQSLTATDSANSPDMFEQLADRRISEVQQKVLSTDSLAQLIAQYHLYGVSKPEEARAMASKMRSKVKLDFVDGVVANPAVMQKETAQQLAAIAFTISFDYGNAKVAQKVTDALVQRFVEEDAKQSHVEATETSAFLAAQIKQMEGYMAEQEQKMAQFRAKYGESGPDVLMFDKQAVVTSTMNLQAIESQITSNEGTQGTLRSQLATVDPYSRVIADGQVLTTPAVQLKALEAQYATMSGQYGPDYPDLVKLRDQIRSLKAEVRGRGGNNSGSAQLQAQITDVRTNLAAAESAEGSNHPDVIALKHQLKSLEKKLASTRASGHDGLKQDADNPAYLELVAQLHAAEEQHKSLERQKETLQAQLEKYQLAIAGNPDIQQQMAKLSRDYDNSQLRYRELKEKKMAADMNEQLNAQRMGQRLVVLEPAARPSTTHPARLLLLLAGLVGAAMAGLGSVILVEAMSKSVHGREYLGMIIGVPPLAAVPYLLSGEEKERLQRRNKSGILRRAA